MSDKPVYTWAIVIGEPPQETRLVHCGKPPNWFRRKAIQFLYGWTVEVIEQERDDG